MLKFLSFPRSFGKQCFAVVDAPFSEKGASFQIEKLFFGGGGEGTMDYCFSNNVFQTMFFYCCFVCFLL